MTDVEWDRVVELLATNWPHQLQPELSLEKFRRDLGDFPVEQVLVSIETFYRDGREFPPNSGHVRGRLADLYFDAPPFFDALKAIRKALNKAPNLMVNDDSERGWHYVDERVAWLDEHAPFIGTFVKAIGIDRVLLTDGSDEARLRNKYEDFVRRARESMIYGDLPPAGLRKLERVRDGQVVELERGKPAPREISDGAGGIRRVEVGQEQPRPVGFRVVAGRGRAA